MDGTTPAQQTFNFNRSSQLKILERAAISTRGPGKAILKALDSYSREGGEAFPSLRELARNAGCSRDTAKRAVHELAALGLVTITRRRRANGSQASNSYAIAWGKLVDMSGGEGGTVHRGEVHHAPGVGAPCTPHPKRPMKRPSKRHGENLMTETISAATTCWGAVLRRSHLLSASTLQMLYRYAVVKGWVSDVPASRLNLFALAHFCAEKGKSPGRYFTDCLRKRRFGVVRQQDERWAARTIHELDAAAGLIAAGESMKGETDERLAVQ